LAGKVCEEKDKFWGKKNGTMEISLLPPPPPPQKKKIPCDTCSCSRITQA